MAGVALNISALWRKKFVEGVTYSADTFAVVVLIHLVINRRSAIRPF